MAALRQLERAVHFFFSFPEPQTLDKPSKKTSKKNKKIPQAFKNCVADCELFARNGRSVSSEACDVSEELRAEFHAVHKRIKEIFIQQGWLNKARLLAKRLLVSEKILSIMVAKYSSQRTSKNQILMLNKLQNISQLCTLT